MFPTVQCYRNGPSCSLGGDVGLVGVLSEKVLSASGDLGLASGVTDPLPQNPEWQIAYPASLTAAAFSFMHRKLYLFAVKQGYSLAICHAACHKNSCNMDSMMLRYYRKEGDINFFVWYSRQHERLRGFPGHSVAFNRLLCPCECTIKKPQQNNRTIPKQSNHIKTRAQFLLLNSVI